MTKERFIEIFENAKRIWDDNSDNCFQGLQIIAKYSDHIVHGAGHDVVWSEEIDTLIEYDIMEEDVVALAKLEWVIVDNTYLACFV